MRAIELVNKRYMVIKDLILVQQECIPHYRQRLIQMLADSSDLVVLFALARVVGHFQASRRPDFSKKPPLRMRYRK